MLLPALSCGAYLDIFSMYNGWHAGSSHGPRYFSDLMPWFSANRRVMVVDAMCRADSSRWRKGLEEMLLAITFAWAIWAATGRARTHRQRGNGTISQSQWARGRRRRFRAASAVPRGDRALVVRPDGSVVEMRVRDFPDFAVGTFALSGAGQ